MKPSTHFGRAARALLSVAFLPAPSWARLSRRAFLSAGIVWSGLAGAQPSAEVPAGTTNEYPQIYRVEAIVFRHTNGGSDRRRATGPADFTDALDPLLVAAANDAARRQLSALAQLLPVAEVPGATTETTPFLESGQETLRPIPPVYSALGDLSTSLQRAVSRLADASEYEPVVSRAWIQLAEPRQATAAVRIHDNSVVQTLEAVSGPAPIPVVRVLPFEPPEQTPSPALAIYRLDGTLRLHQRQFLHLELDLVWQTRARTVPDPAVEPGPGTGANFDLAVGAEQAPDSGRPLEGEWELHRLQQSRVVRPGRLEYFDSSLFGVLVRIERFEQVVPEIDDDTPEAEPGTPDSEMNSPPDSGDAGRPVTEPGR